jgi:site-specific DNA-methyltransferase (adenine-specific)
LNQLYYGDNLTVLREGIEREGVDLIYLDPPFNSQASYNVLFRSTSGERSQAQIEAFEDTWHWNDSAEKAFDEVMSGNARLAEVLRALRSFLRENDMMAYLTMMAVRLQEMHRALKPTGSLYLHCDPTASHYLKLILDSVFDPDKFLNEVIWKRTSAHGDASRRFAGVHDTILAYSRSKESTWNQIFVPYSEEYTLEHFVHKDPDGRLFRRTGLAPIFDTTS